MGHAAHPAPATRPALEVAHILREGADAYRQTHRLSAQQQRVVNALVSCRTAALGGFKSHCNHCGAETIQYASCRNRHCPKCQTLAQTRWVERQCADLLNIAHWHVVFTLPHELNPIARTGRGVEVGVVAGRVGQHDASRLDESGGVPAPLSVSVACREERGRPVGERLNLGAASKACVMVLAPVGEEPSRRSASVSASAWRSGSSARASSTTRRESGMSASRACSRIAACVSGAQ